VFCENSNAGKTILHKFYLFTITVANFTEINIPDHRLAKHHSNMLAELSK